MSCHLIYYKDGAKMMRPVESREEYLALRNTGTQKSTVDAVRKGKILSKRRLLQMNYSCLPNEDGTLKGSTTMSTTVGMDIDHISKEQMQEIKERILGKKDELDVQMLEKVTRQMDELQQVLQECPGKFFYAENFVYAPAVQKSKALLQATGDRVLFMRGEESHSGSHAPHAALWSANGGGSLIRQGCHPLSALLYLKKAAGDGSHRVVSVMGDMGYVVPSLTDEERKNILARPRDVEDIANVVITFADGTKAHIFAGDMVLGGVRNDIQVYTTGGVHQCRIAPNDQMRVYHVDDSYLANEYFTEKLEVKTGWQSIFLDEDIARGYVDELRDFLLCAAEEKDQPEADFDLAYETIRVIYAAYLSACTGRRIDL